MFCTTYTNLSELMMAIVPINQEIIHLWSICKRIAVAKVVWNNRRLLARVRCREAPRM